MKLHQLWRIALWLSILQLSVFLVSDLLTGAGISFLGNSFLSKFSLHNRCFTSEALHTRFAFRASRKIPRSPRLAHKAPVMQARIRLTASVWTVLLLPLCDQARPWFRFSKRTSSVAGLALCLVAFSRASLVVLFCGENGTAVLSTELWLRALIPAWWIERQSSQTEESSQKSEAGNQ